MTQLHNRQFNPPDPARRHFLASAAAAPLAVAAAGHAATMTVPALEADPFEYEIVRTEAEWRDFLNPEEFNVLRKGLTELPRTSPLWNDYREGEFGCRGCGLHVYSSGWRAEVDKGWVFFGHAEPRSVLTSIDGERTPSDMDEGAPPAMIEVHCRRCASHLGHIVIVDGALLHCINGTSLTFSPSSA